MPDKKQADLHSSKRIVFDLGATATNSADDALSKTAIVLVDRARLTAECLAAALSDASTEMQISVVSERVACGSEQGLVLCNINAALIADPATRKGVIEQIGIDSEIPIIIIADDDDPSAAFDAIQMGARGYFPSSLPVRLLVAAIRLVLAGGVFLPPNAITTRGMTSLP